MKLGRKLKDGDVIPSGSAFIRYWEDGEISTYKVKVNDTGKYHKLERSEAYELLDFEFPEKPKEPKNGEYWTFLVKGVKHFGQIQTPFVGETIIIVSFNVNYHVSYVQLLDRFEKVK